MKKIHMFDKRIDMQQVSHMIADNEKESMSKT